MKARERQLTLEEARSYINMEFFQKKEGEEFTPDDVYEAICERASKDNCKVDSSIKQVVLAVFTELTLNRAILRNANGTYQINQKRK